MSRTASSRRSYVMTVRLGASSPASGARVGLARSAADQDQRRTRALRAGVDPPAGHHHPMVAHRAEAVPRPATSRGWRLPK
jgi:hypothetical protein